MQVELPSIALRITDSRHVVPAREGKPRDGGKPAAKRLLKPIKPNTKRAHFLQWFLDDATGRTIGATMANFKLSRQNVITYWITIQREHGIGYTLANNTITAIMPANCDPASIFGVES